MKKAVISLALSAFILAGCSGARMKVTKLAPYPSGPTKKDITIYVDKHQVKKRNFLPIARITIKDRTPLASETKMRRDIVRKARSIGADAILLYTYINKKGKTVRGYALVKKETKENFEESEGSEEFEE